MFVIVSKDTAKFARITQFPSDVAALSCPECSVCRRTTYRITGVKQTDHRLMMPSVTNKTNNVTTELSFCRTVTGVLKSADKHISVFVYIFGVIFFKEYFVAT